MAQAVTRTKFDKKKVPFSFQVSPEERAVIEHVAHIKEDYDRFHASLTTRFLTEFIDKSLEYYKDKLVYENDLEKQKLLRGIIQGQQEIKNVISLMQKVRNDKI